ncbi:hypothetical protein [Phytomonospora endophytica]|uniref:Uncharacterized protein n=1 Tax=Phytomonospora endophytica TaxID=714109 RepID=A0A841FTT7_9ACTN|nr:hypothetical protein [Phytomonospora endophytica]MBB6037148.1 hypothetical protein [Phytomonospora endophytica]GIG71188.1 hypothetical protein Pen01_74830 [Phytomonospora endophytica]
MPMRSIWTTTTATALLLLVATPPAAAATPNAAPQRPESCSSVPTDGSCYEWPGDPRDG